MSSAHATVQWAAPLCKFNCRGHSVVACPRNTQVLLREAPSSVSLKLNFQQNLDFAGDEFESLQWQYNQPASAGFKTTF